MADGHAQTFRATTNRVIAVAGWVAASLGAATTVALAATGRPTRLLDLLPLALLALLAWELFWRPRVVVDDEGVELVDLFRTNRIPWSTIIDVQTRWALTIVTPRRRYRASAAPAPGARSRPRTGRDGLHPGVGRDGGIQVSGAIGTDSGDAAAIVRDRWRRLAESGGIELGRADTDRPTTHVHVGALAAALLLAAGTAASLIPH